MQLGKRLLAENLTPSGIKVGPLNDFPEKILQFGEGNFMRAFVDWMVNELNCRDLFHGRVVVVQPLENGLVPQLNEQDGLYTLYLRGVQKGVVKEEKSIITSVSRGIDPYSDWAGLLACAENPDLRFIVSNTTEAGITYSPEPLTADTPITFPAKLTSFLYHRFKSFGGDPRRGMVIIPCELIDRNGDELKKTVLQYCRDWNLPGDFAAWLENSNHFLNSLVDRIVTGFPRDTASLLFEELGYEDKLLDTGEIFHLWVIEGASWLAEELPFHKAGLNVLWVPDMTPYRTRKVRILNGAHTVIVPVAYLYGLDTVKEAVDDALAGSFLRRSLYEEIVPTLELPRQEVLDFAEDVMERFQNPYIRHYLIDIALNSTSKFKARVLPSLLAYAAARGRPPRLLAFSLAALCVFYRGSEIGGNTPASRQYHVRDDEDVLIFFRDAWSACDGSLAGCRELALKVLRNHRLWGEDLSKDDSLAGLLSADLFSILGLGMAKAVENILCDSGE